MTNAPQRARATTATHGGRVDERLAALEGTEAALVLGTGMAAIACTMLSLLRSGDHVLASAWLSGTTRQFFERELPSFGVEATFVDPTATRGWRRMIRPNTRLLFLASPVDETTRVADLNPPRLLAQELGIALVVDSTWASPINFRPVEHGADVVIHSGAPYLHVDPGLQAGVVCGAEALIDEVREKMVLWGQEPDAVMLTQLDRGLCSLELRVSRRSANAAQVAQWAASHPAIQRTYYPGLASHPDYEIALATLTGFGSTVVLDLSDDDADARRFASRLHLFRQATVMGGSDSHARAIAATAVTAHSQPSALPMPIGAGAILLGIGIEDAADLIADLAQALE